MLVGRMRTILLSRGTASKCKLTKDDSCKCVVVVVVVVVDFFGADEFPSHQRKSKFVVLESVFVCVY